MNKLLLKSKMAAAGDTAEKLAGILQITSQTFSAKINEKKAEFTQTEIEIIAKRYNLTPDELRDIFFSRLVSNEDTN